MNAGSSNSPFLGLKASFQVRDSTSASNGFSHGTIIMAVTRDWDLTKGSPSGSLVASLYNNTSSGNEVVALATSPIKKDSVRLDVVHSLFDASVQLAWGRSNVSYSIGFRIVPTRDMLDPVSIKRYWSHGSTTPQFAKGFLNLSNDTAIKTIGALGGPIDPWDDQLLWILLFWILLSL